MSRYWISFHESCEDYRPKNYPPPEWCLGWWCTGHVMDEAETPILCVLVEAPSEEEAKALIENQWTPLKDHPDLPDWRFCEEKEADYAPFKCRFPRSHWMRV